MSAPLWEKVQNFTVTRDTMKDVPTPDVYSSLTLAQYRDMQTLVERYGDNPSLDNLQLIVIPLIMEGIAAHSLIELLVTQMEVSEQLLGGELLAHAALLDQVFEGADESAISAYQADLRAAGVRLLATK